MFLGRTDLFVDTSKEEVKDVDSKKLGGLSQVSETEKSTVKQIADTSHPME